MFVHERLLSAECLVRAVAKVVVVVMAFHGRGAVRCCDHDLSSNGTIRGVKLKIYGDSFDSYLNISASVRSELHSRVFESRDEPCE